MEKQDILNALEKLNADSKKRKFTQRVELIANLKALDLKKTENQVDFYVALPHHSGKKKSICALVGPELKDEGDSCDEVITLDDFQKYQQDKKLAKALADRHDYFVAQANIMPKVAQAFGRVLGPRGKMPNPKAGCIVPPKGSLKPVYDKLQYLERVSAKTQSLVQVAIGTQEMKPEEIADNAQTVYDQLIHHLPLEINNLKNVLIKYTMSKPEKVA